jgi:hypothetical protein
LQEFVNSLPPEASAELRAYLGSVPVKPPSRLPRMSQLHAQPHWISFPVALVNHRQRNIKASAIPSTLIHDILSSQYFIYLAVRLRDDLLDGQATGRTLTEVSHSLEQTAGEILKRWYEPSSEFWTLFRRYMGDTAKGISEVGRLQRRIVRDPGRMPDGYARTSSIFKLGSAAVCVSTGRVRLMGSLEMAFDHLAIGGQIIDDVKDIVEDIERGRYNYAVQMLFKGHGRAASPVEVSRRVLSALLNPRNLEEVVSVAVHHFKTARRLLKQLHLRELYDIPMVQQRAAGNLLEYVHRRRIGALFSGRRTI